jgi:hypothetical protein
MSTFVGDMYSDRNTVGTRWRSLYFATVGAFAGFLASLMVLAADVASARVLGFAPFMLLRFYATLHDGSAALLMDDWRFFLSAFFMHLAVGSLLGAVFVVIVSGRELFEKLSHYLGAGVLFGLAIWVLNFYLLLSWIQPLMNGRAYILENIPWWVAAGTHAIFGITVASVSYAFRNDVEETAGSVQFHSQSTK